jgi:hypothetical protein
MRKVVSIQERRLERVWQSHTTKRESLLAAIEFLLRLFDRTKGKEHAAVRRMLQAYNRELDTIEMGVAAQA